MLYQYFALTLDIIAAMLTLTLIIQLLAQRLLPKLRSAVENALYTFNLKREIRALARRQTHCRC